MKSITIHNLEPELEKSIVAEAKRRRLSLNKTMKKLLRETLGIDTKQVEDRRKELKGIVGAWTRKEAEEFERNIADTERIDKTDWA